MNSEFRKRLRIFGNDQKSGVNKTMRKIKGVEERKVRFQISEGMKEKIKELKGIAIKGSALGLSAAALLGMVSYYKYKNEPFNSGLISEPISESISGSISGKKEELVEKFEEKFVAKLIKLEMEFLELNSKSELSDKEQKRLENISAEIIQITNLNNEERKSNLLKSINEIYSGLNCEITGVGEIGMYNYEKGGSTITVKLYVNKSQIDENGNVIDITDEITAPVLDNQGTIIAASLLEWQKDNVNLAYARILAPIVANMSNDEVGKYFVVGEQGNKKIDIYNSNITEFAKGKLDDRARKNNIINGGNER